MDQVESNSEGHQSEPKRGKVYLRLRTWRYPREEHACASAPEKERERRGTGLRLANSTTRWAKPTTPQRVAPLDCHREQSLDHVPRCYLRGRCVAAIINCSTPSRRTGLNLTCAPESHGPSSAWRWRPRDAPYLRVRGHNLPHRTRPSLHRRVRAWHACPLLEDTFDVWNTRGKTQCHDWS